jgi:hypothetical protein
MASKNVRKIYSKTSNELVKVDMADRDGQGNVIHETYAKKTDVGTKKYRHNITAFWSGTYNSKYYQGSVSLSFIDGTSSSYSTNGNRTYNDADFFTFLEDHMALKHSGENHIPASGSVSKGSGSTAELKIITSFNYHADYDTWYVTYAYISSSTREFGTNYAKGDNLFPNISGKYMSMYDLVEEL